MVIAKAIPSHGAAHFSKIKESYSKGGRVRVALCEEYATSNPEVRLISFSIDKFVVGVEFIYYFVFADVDYAVGDGC